VGPSIAGVLVDHFKFEWASVFVVVTELNVFLITAAFVGYRYVHTQDETIGYAILLVKIFPN
jgi:hypothetical protein